MLSPRSKVGLFIIGGVLLFGIGIFFIGDRKKVFSNNYEIYTEFANVNGLQTGSKVRVSGMDAGEVLEMYVPNEPQKRFRLKLRVQDKLRPLVRFDSVASIETEGLVGNEFLQINKGSDRAKECPPGGTIPSKEPLDFAALMQQANQLMSTTRGTIDEVGDRANRALENIAKVSGHADELVVSLRGDLKQITARADQITADIADVVQGIKSGRGVVGKMLTDEQLSTDVAATVSNAKQASANLNEATGRVNGMLSAAQERDVIAHLDDTLANTRAITQQLRQALTEFLENNEGGENGARTLRETVASARQTLVNLADDTEAIKHNFLLRGFFNRRGFFNLTQLTPEQYRKTKFLKQDSALRVWLQSGEIFAQGANKQEILTDAGAEALNRAMAAFVPQLPNSAVMIEGYADQGTPADRFVVARRRVDLARSHLLSHFQLNPKLVGTMPLGDRPPEQTGKARWSGISLVMIKESK